MSGVLVGVTTARPAAGSWAAGMKRAVVLRRLLRGALAGLVRRRLVGLEARSRRWAGRCSDRSAGRDQREPARCRTGHGARHQGGSHDRPKNQCACSVHGWIFCCQPQNELGIGCEFWRRLGPRGRVAIVTASLKVDRARDGKGACRGGRGKRRGRRSRRGPGQGGLSEMEGGEPRRPGATPPATRRRGREGRREARDAWKRATWASPSATRAARSAWSWSVFNYFAGAPERLLGDTIPVAGGVDMTFREPLGVVGLIVPWNFPIAITSWKVGPALAAGNTIVLEAGRPDSAHRSGAGANRARGRFAGGSAQRGRGRRPHGGRAAGAAPRRRQGRLHGLNRRRASASARWRRSRSSASRWSSAASRRTSCSRTPTSARPRRRASGCVRKRRAGLLRAVADPRRALGDGSVHAARSRPRSKR